MPLFRADGEGYTFAGESVHGFADRPELPQRVRLRLARLGPSGMINSISGCARSAEV
jgi:hypothetical protein